MSISGILSRSYNQSQLSGASSNYQQQMQQLSKDLTSGNLSAAQSDFATLQAAFSQPATTSGSTVLAVPAAALPAQPSTRPHKPSTNSSPISNPGTCRPLRRISRPSNRLSRIRTAQARRTAPTMTTISVAEAGMETQPVRTPCSSSLVKSARARRPATFRALNRPTRLCSNNCNSSPSGAEH
jgi:hypothetical protein